MVNRVSITLPKSGAPQKHAIYHFKNGNRKISISANVLYGLYGNAMRIPADRRQYLRYFNTHPVNNQRALQRAQFVVSHVLKNRLGSRHVNSGHAGQIRYFATMNKRLRNGTNRVQYNNIYSLLEYYNPRFFSGTLTRNNNANINSYMNTLAQKYGVTRNAVISYITSIHANALEHAASRGTNTRGPLQATKYFFNKLPNVAIQRNNAINKNTNLNKLLTNYYTNYSGAPSIRLPKNKKNVERYEAEKQVRLKRKRDILSNIRSHLNTIGRVPVAAAAGGNNGRAAGGNNGRAAGGAQRRTTSPNRRAGRANTATTWRRKA